MAFDSYDEDRFRAEKLQPAFRRFIWAFLEKDAGATCRNLLDKETFQFKGGNVGQLPEEFTQKTIVDGVLKALGYEFTHHPAELLKDEPTQPDIELRNLGDQCVGIVECKALNRERNNEEATKDIIEYFETNAFARYKKELDMQYLVGIATDGFDWKLWIKDLKTNEFLPEFHGEYSLVDDSKGLHHCYHSEVKEKTKTHWPTIREELSEGFVSTFGIHNLPGSR